ncbi:MAG: polysaccharide pyruvyl transferase family protein [bacterium]|nr:polysaccharide pyruvyl transferase family protein [bacterium]
MMEHILLLDTSVATHNIGDEIIMECVRKELQPLLEKHFVLTLPTHVSPFHWYQVWRKSLVLQSFANCKLKFVGGSNILIPDLLTHYPQWNINLFNYQPLKGSILVGVGAGQGAEQGSNWYTRHIYKKMLNSEFYHSARDERSKQYMEYLGLKAINTGCVTMWMLTPDFCKQIPTSKAEKVVFTITAGCFDALDQQMLNTLLKNYKEVYFWPQGIHDYQHFQQFENKERVHILPATKDAYDRFLTENDTDYVGTRLHGGVYAMRHARRAIIIAIDERARAINEKNHLNCIEKSNISELESMLNSEIKTEIIMPFSEINRWKAQFEI